MISDAALVAWLILFDYQTDRDHNFSIPEDVKRELVKRGWLVDENEKRWDGADIVNIGDKGRTVIELNAFEFGFELVELQGDEDA